MFNLKKELSKKICKDLGVTPSSFGKTGITINDFLVKALKIQDEKDLVQKVPMWYAEARGKNWLICCLLSVLDSNPDNLEIAGIIGCRDFEGEVLENNIIGFRFNWGDESGVFMNKLVDKWVELSLSQFLQLALGFENMVQDGVLWNVSEVPEKFRKEIIKVIEND